jgi:hypothetical protein
LTTAIRTVTVLVTVLAIVLVSVLVITSVIGSAAGSVAGVTTSVAVIGAVRVMATAFVTAIAAVIGVVSVGARESVITAATVMDAVAVIAIVSWTGAGLSSVTIAEGVGVGNRGLLTTDGGSTAGSVWALSVSVKASDGETTAPWVTSAGKVMAPALVMALVAVRGWLSSTDAPAVSSPAEGVTVGRLRPVAEEASAGACKGSQATRSSSVPTRAKTKTKSDVRRAMDNLR